MKTNDGTRYVKTTDDDGNTYYCPINAAGQDARTVDPDACVEADVAGRYAGLMGRSESI